MLGNKQYDGHGMAPDSRFSHWCTRHTCQNQLAESTCRRHNTSNLVYDIWFNYRLIHYIIVTKRICLFQIHQNCRARDTFALFLGCFNLHNSRLLSKWYLTLHLFVMHLGKWIVSRQHEYFSWLKTLFKYVLECSWKAKYGFSSHWFLTMYHILLLITWYLS